MTDAAMKNCQQEPSTNRLEVFFSETYPNNSYRDALQLRGVWSYTVYHPSQIVSASSLVSFRFLLQTFTHTNYLILSQSL